MSERWAQLYWQAYEWTAQRYWHPRAKSSGTFEQCRPARELNESQRQRIAAQRQRGIE